MKVMHVVGARPNFVKASRILTDHLADGLFTSCRDANENLSREGLPASRVFFVGNVMVDTLVRMMPAIERSAAPPDSGRKTGND